MFSMIPFPVKIMAIIFIVLGAAGWGYMKGSAHAEVELANYQAKAEKQISELKTENTRISDNVTTEYVDRVNTIHDKEIIYRDRLVELGEGKNNLSNGWVELHDAAAKPVKPAVADVKPDDQDYWTTPVGEYRGVVDAPVTYGSVASNHCQNRFKGQQVGKPGLDDWGIVILQQLR